MAVSNECDNYPTESLISKHGRKHFRIPVRSQHWQLRSLISAEQQRYIYFPGGHGSNHVKRLNTTNDECETIKLLTFVPRCLVADKGWVCCGGENGEFVAIRSNEPSLDAEFAHILENGSASTALSFIGRGAWNDKSLVAKSIKLAKDRVNCITLWFPPTTVPACDDAYTEPVAILANNDKTVTLVSLQDFETKPWVNALDVLKYPDFVNRAIISPDGSLLVAILDDPYLYVHTRVAKSGESTPTQLRGETATQWQETQRILLRSQKKSDASDSRGSFAACFSTNGALLAVGTQHGTISIFNTALLRIPEAEPLITTFESSRPRSGPGAVRDMAFCPGPYDVLAWTEDRGNIGVADVRSHFVIRQIIDINDRQFKSTSVLDRYTIDPRVLDGRRDRGDTSLASALGSNLSLSERRRNDLDTLNTPLTANETLVLEAMQLDRRRRERARVAAMAQRASPGQTAPTGGSGASWTNLARLGTGSANNDSSRDGERRRSTGIGSVIDDLLPSYGEPRNEQDRPRRLPSGWRTADTIPRRPVRRQETIGETTASRMEQLERSGSNAYLGILDILDARDRTAGDREDEDSSIVPIINQVVNRMEESAIRNTQTPDHGVWEVPPSPDNTSGLAWSEDGRILYIGAQNGIYELRLNVEHRKFCPSTTMR